MTYYEFKTTTHGKWILAGEHAVLRGHPALVFPITDKKLTLRYQPSTEHQRHTLTAAFAGDEGTGMEQLFWNVLEHGMHLLGKPLEELHGHFHLQSNIPVGVGMGASAALCVAISRWFSAQQLFTPLEIQHFAIELEHLFHGKSSGLDIAGVAANAGIYFQNGVSSPIKQTWQPTWRLSTCGQIGMTSRCIKQVQTMWEINPSHAEEIDQHMHRSVIEAHHALENQNIQKLAEALDIAAECFQQWGLISAKLKEHMQALRDAGAIAVKPTGSGGGGFAVSLWNQSPMTHSISMIRT